MDKMSAAQYIDIRSIAKPIGACKSRESLGIPENES
jgi:hypothetical protein